MSKRTLLLAEHLTDEVLLELQHRRLVFTIPKALRAFFRHDRRLFSSVSRLIFALVAEFYTRRAQVMELVVEGKRSLVEASGVMGVSYRQAKRILRRLREEGAAGLVHRNLDKPSGRRIDEGLRPAVLRKYKEAYADFGPTLAAEKLAERDKLAVDHETSRRWLIAEGIWKARRQRRRYRSRRDRRQRFGELVQVERRLLQIQRQKRVRLPAPETQVIVRKWLDGSVHVFTKGNTELLVEELEARP